MNPNNLKNYDLLFWDFDGTIKDSVDVKSDLFEKLFLPFGENISKRVRIHHEKNGGVSRLQKIPLYLEWAGLPVNDETIKQYCNEFSSLVLRKVVESPWVEGVKEYLDNHHDSQHFVLITATPQEEIVCILEMLRIRDYFKEILGAPNEKSLSISNMLNRFKVNPNNAIVIGDAETDYLAAMNNNVPFLLRRTKINRDLQGKHDGLQFNCLNE